MAKPAFLSPGSVVRVNGSVPSESGSIGYVRKTRPTNGDDVLVTIIDSPLALLAGTSLSYKTSTLEPVE